MSRRKTIFSYQLKGQSKLVIAILKDHNLVTSLLKNGEDPNGTDYERRSYLHLAASMGKAMACKALIAAGAKVDARDSDGLTPLHRACRNNHDNVVSILLENGACSTVKDKEWRTPLHVCAANNSLECAKLFTEQMASLNMTDRSGASPLHHAAFNGNCDMITFLLREGSAPTVFDRKARRPLHYAASIDNADGIRLLLEAGAAINCHDFELMTPLHVAAVNGSVDSLVVLLDHGAESGSPDRDGNTPLHLAAINGQDDIIEELVSRNPDLLNCRNTMGMTALHFAASSMKGAASIDQLLSYVNVKDSYYDSESDTPSPSVTQSGPREPINIEARDKGGRTPLHLAAKFNRSMAFNELVRMGADLMARDIHGMTPFHYLAVAGNISMIRSIMENHPEFDIDCCDRYGLTALHHSSFLGFNEVVKTLLYSDHINPSLGDLRGRSALSYACLSGNQSVVKTLVLASNNEGVEYDFTQLDDFGRNALHYLAASGWTNDNMAFLLNYTGYPRDEGEKWFDVDQMDVYGRTPLLYACEFDPSATCVDALISSGATVNASDLNGYYSLNYAAASGNYASIKVLLATHYWNDALFKVCPSECSIVFGHPECLDMLLNEGLYSNLLKCIEYAREDRKTRCIEVIEAFVMATSATDESMAEYTQYFSCNESAFQTSFSMDNSSDAQHPTLSQSESPIKSEDEAVIIQAPTPPKVNGFSHSPPVEQGEGGDHKKMTSPVVNNHIETKTGFNSDELKGNQLMDLLFQPKKVNGTDSVIDPPSINNNLHLVTSDPVEEMIKIENHQPKEDIEDNDVDGVTVLQGAVPIPPPPPSMISPSLLSIGDVDPSH